VFFPFGLFTTQTDGGKLRTIRRITTVLNCFSRETPMLSLSQISESLGLPRSTTHRLLKAMEVAGFLMRDPASRKYRLGYRLLYWGRQVQDALDLRGTSFPILQALARSTGETAILSVRDGNEGVCLEMVESSQPVRLTMDVGKRLRLHAGASAKVLWAFLPEAEIRRILGEIDLLVLKPNTITDPARMYQELMDIRERGYATSFEETDSGAMGVAAPVYDSAGQVVAGIGIAAPMSRITPKQVPEIAPVVVDAGRQVSARLGALLDHDFPCGMAAPDSR
jgi:IclR family KDG regulon transcriptional repressor